MNNSDQPAFPESCTQEGYKANVFSGLTKREYFAAMAMQGMVSAITKLRYEDDMQDIIVNRPKDISELAVLYADTILDELDKIKTQPSL